MRGDSEARRANSVESPHVRIWNERVVRRLCQRAVAIADTQVGELPHDLQPLGVLRNAAEPAARRRSNNWRLRGGSDSADIAATKMSTRYDAPTTSVTQSRRSGSVLVLPVATACAARSV